MGTCSIGLHVTQFSGLCVFRACTLLNDCRFKGQCLSLSAKKQDSTDEKGESMMYVLLWQA